MQSLTLLMQIPIERSGKVRLWNGVVDLLSQGKIMKSAMHSVAVESGLGNTVIRNAIHCLGQVRPL